MKRLFAKQEHCFLCFLTPISGHFLKKFVLIAGFITILPACVNLFSPTEGSIRAAVPKMFKIGGASNFISRSNCFSVEFDVEKSPIVNKNELENTQFRLNNLKEQTSAWQSGTDMPHLKRGEYLVFEDLPLLRRVGKTPLTLNSISEKIHGIEALEDPLSEVLGNARACWNEYDSEQKSEIRYRYTELLVDEKILILLFRPKTQWVAVCMYKNGRLLVFGSGL